MEVDGYARLKVFKRACSEPGCEHAYQYDTVPELIKAVHEHNEAAHQELRWPNVLALTAYDKRFLRDQNISID